MGYIDFKLLALASIRQLCCDGGSLRLMSSRGLASTTVLHDGTLMDQIDSPIPLTPDSRLRRRTVTHAAAWTIPALSVTIATPATAASVITGSIAFNPVQYRGTLNSAGTAVVFPTLTGVVTLSSGPLPSTVILSFSGPARVAWTSVAMPA